MSDTTGQRIAPERIPGLFLNAPTAQREAAFLADAPLTGHVSRRDGTELLIAAHRPAPGQSIC